MGFGVLLGPGQLRLRALGWVKFCQQRLKIAVEVPIQDSSSGKPIGSVFLLPIPWRWTECRVNICEYAISLTWILWIIFKQLLELCPHFLRSTFSCAASYNFIQLPLKINGFCTCPHGGLLQIISFLFMGDGCRWTRREHRNQGVSGLALKNHSNSALRKDVAIVGVIFGNPEDLYHGKSLKKITPFGRIFFPNTYSNKQI